MTPWAGRLRKTRGWRHYGELRLVMNLAYLRISRRGTRGVRIRLHRAVLPEEISRFMTSGCQTDICGRRLRGSVPGPGDFYPRLPDPPAGLGVRPVWEGHRGPAAPDSSLQPGRRPDDEPFSRAQGRKTMREAFLPGCDNISEKDTEHGGKGNERHQVIPVGRFSRPSLFGGVYVSRSG